MGSRKKTARNKNPHTKVKVGLLKKPKKKPVPVILPGTEESAGAEWKDRTTLSRNYKALGIVTDPNPSFGRDQGGREAATLFEEEPAEAPLAHRAETDPEIWRAALGERGEKPAPAKRLTAKQTLVVRRLVEAHGDDVQAMFRDRTLNAMQHTPAVLRGLLASYRAYPGLSSGEAGGRDFRAPQKPPKMGGRGGTRIRHY